MPLARKAAIVHAALLALTLWPAAHIALVYRYDMSPWKLAGWGMYTTPRFSLLGMEIYGRDASADAWEQLTQPSPALQAAASTFLERHRWLRGLAGTDALRNVVAQDRPTWRQMRVVVSYPWLDLADGRVAMREDERLLSLPAR